METMYTDYLKVQDKMQFYLNILWATSSSKLFSSCLCVHWSRLETISQRLAGSRASLPTRWFHNINIIKPLLNTVTTSYIIFFMVYLMTRWLARVIKILRQHGLTYGSNILAHQHLSISINAQGLLILSYEDLVVYQSFYFVKQLTPYQRNSKG